MDMSSWKSSLQAYGIFIWEICENHEKACACDARTRSYLCFIFAASAFKRLLLHVSNSDESTEVTHIDLVGI